MENETRQSKGGEVMKKRSAKKISIAVVLFLIIGGLIASSGYFFYQYRQSKESLQAAQKKEVSSVITKIGKHIVLPKDEQPTLATVTDIKKLKGQAFFKSAVNGDKLLIYAKAKKAILYRPSNDMIIEFAPLIMDTTSSAPPPKADDIQPSATPSGKVR
jgi:predicted negative regulator of RcsB-dependent stress response